MLDNMPATEHFKVQILVGDQPIPEYKKDGNVYVESNLNIKGFSYHIREHDLVGAEYESQVSFPLPLFKDWGLLWSP
jgi:hypothetical protein